MSIGARIYAELQGDRVIWMIVAMLALISMLAVYSSTGSMAHVRYGGDTEGMLINHVIFLIMGLFITYLAYLMHYEKYKIAAPFLMLVAVPLLVYTLFFGVEINGAKRWIELPFISRTFQTSDFAKLALILYVAREITRHKDYIKDLKKAFMPIIIPVLIVCGLIAPADLSTAMILLGTCLAMMFLGRVSIKYIMLLVLLWMFLFTSMIAAAQLDIFPDTIRLDTWMNRLSEFRAGSDSFQVEQSKIAIANGGLFGVGPGNSIQRNFLPSGFADYIYAIICEEYGLIGGFVILGLYVMLFFRVTAMVSKDPVKAFGMMVALGLSLNLVTQALVNMAVSVDLVPVTGLTLPIISKGGTSLLFTCIFFGIILSVSKNVERGAMLGRMATPEIQQTKEAQNQASKGQSSGQQKTEGGQRRDNRHQNNRQSGGNRGNQQHRDNRNRSGGNRNKNYNRNRQGGGNRDNNNRDGGGNHRNNRDNRN